MIIAIDGPAASGKGTIGRRLADQLGLAFLDTGLLYRAAAKIVLENKLDPSDPSQVVNAVKQLRIENLRADGLRTQEISNLSSQIARMPEVRDILGALQREFAHHPPAMKNGAVLDGRDIGTVICPDADVKLFITASLEVRATRRYRELLAGGHKTTFDAVHRDLGRRDQRDSSRSAAPLRTADDAIVLDTTDLTVDEAYHRALSVIMTKTATRRER
jgi:cytidylate kinase